jgi:hypothetical protein
VVLEAGLERVAQLVAAGADKLAAEVGPLGREDHLTEERAGCERHLLPRLRLARPLLGAPDAGARRDRRERGRDDQT